MAYCPRAKRQQPARDLERVGPAEGNAGRSSVPARRARHGTHAICRTDRARHPRTPCRHRLCAQRREHLRRCQQRAVFRLSLSGLGEQVFLAPLAKRVFERAPGVRLESIPSPFRDLSRTLAARESEVAIGLLDFADAQLRQVHLYDENYRVIGPPELSRDEAAAVDLCRERIVLAAPSLTYADDVEKVMRERGLADNVCLRIRNFGALPEMLASLNVFAVVPGYLGRRMAEAGQASLLDMTLPRGRQKVQLVWHINTMQDPGCIWLREQIRDLFQSPDICDDDWSGQDRPQGVRRHYTREQTAWQHR